MTHDAVREMMARLRQEYLAEVPGRLAELRRAVDEWLAGGTPKPSPPMLFHRLSGSAGAYGFSDVSALCRATEQWLATEPGRNAESAAHLAAAITGVEEGFARGPTGPDVAG